MKSALFSRIVLTCMLLGIFACSGGGGGSGAPDGGDGDVTSYAGGWVSITASDVENDATFCSSLWIEGDAFISNDYFRCCSGSAEDTGVSVTWQNLSTGASGAAFQRVRTCYLISTPYLCDHQWSADIPLKEGENLIKVRAQETAGGTGWGTDTLTVTKTGSSYTVEGRVATTSGSPLSFQESKIDVYIFNDALTRRVVTGSDGSYRLDCIPNGTYTVEPRTPLSYEFSPKNHQAVVDGAGLRNLDFSTDAYFLSGTIVYSTSGTPVKLVLVEVTGDAGSATVSTDESGVYRLVLPNGNFTVRPYFPIVGNPDDFSPASVQVEINGADLPNVDFTFSP